MPDVRVRHDQGMVAHASYAAALDRAAIDGDRLANLIVVADFKPGGLALVGNVLRRQSDRAERKEDIIDANSGRSFDGHMRRQTAILAQFDSGAHHAIRPDFTRGRNLRERIDNRRGMYVRGN